MSAHNPTSCSHSRVVIGSAFGYSAFQLKPFYESFHWAQLHRRADGLLLVHRTDPARAARMQILAANRTRAALNAHGLQAVAPDEDYPFTSTLTSLGFGKQALPPPHSLRYLHVVAVLRARPCYKKVVLTDTRDVYFQADPFVAIRDANTLYATQEQVRSQSSCCTLQGNPTNRKWLERMDPVIPTPLRNRGGPELPILNSGITLGGGGAVLRYAEKMVELMGVLQSHNLLNFGGMDQGVHNAVVWGRLVSGIAVEVLTNEEGPVFHNVCWDPKIKGLQATPQHATDPFGALMNGHRTRVAAIVHQYDRCPSLMAKLPFLQNSAQFELRVGEPATISRLMQCRTWLKKASAAGGKPASSPLWTRLAGGVEGYQEQSHGVCLTTVPPDFAIDPESRCAVRYSSLQEAAGNCSLHSWCRGVVRDGGLPCGQSLHGVPRRAEFIPHDEVD